MAKAAASDAGREVTAAAIQLHGGIGFTWEADVHWLFKRAQLDAALLGGAATHRARLARIAAARRRRRVPRGSVAGVRACVRERAAVADELPQVGARPQRQLEHAEARRSRGPRCWAAGSGASPRFLPPVPTTNWRTPRAPSRLPAASIGAKRS